MRGEPAALGLPFEPGEQGVPTGDGPRLGWNERLRRGEEALAKYDEASIGVRRHVDRHSSPTVGKGGVGKSRRGRANKAGGPPSRWLRLVRTSRIGLEFFTIGEYGSLTIMNHPEDERLSGRSS